MKKVVALILAFVLLIGCIPAAFAASPEAVEAANALYALGLFKGVGKNADGTPNFALDRAPTRHEAVTMLVRLLGKEDAAKAGEWDIPFTDVADWAVPYVGYAYENGLTKGVSSTRFGGNSTVTASQYITFVLRALGYDSSADFKWDKAWELSDELGITNGEYTNNSTFSRGDAAIVSANALPASMKESKETLYDKLISDGVFSIEAYTEVAYKAEEVTEITIRLIKVGDQYYTTTKNGPRLSYTYTFDIIGDLIFLQREDITVYDIDGSLSCNRRLWRFLYTGCIADVISSEPSDNPYFDYISSKTRFPELENFPDRFGRDEVVLVPPTGYYYPQWWEHNGYKLYRYVGGQGETLEVHDGIRYYNGAICLNDLFKVFGINRTITFGQYYEYWYYEVN